MKPKYSPNVLIIGMLLVLIKPYSIQAQKDLSAEIQRPKKITWEDEREILEQSRNIWEEEKEKCLGNYSYRVSWSSWTGFGNETIIIVRDNRVIERQYRAFSTPQINSPTTNRKNWKEEGSFIGSHKDGHPPKTLDQLYIEASNLMKQPIPPHHRPYLRLDQNNLLLACYTRDTRIADDAPINGVRITSISLGINDKLMPDNKHPSYDQWLKNGKTIPKNMMFIGGSPWFDERTGSKRSPREVYEMIFKEKKMHSKPNPILNPKKRKPFPKHWGAPPKRQTRDLRPLPGGYGMGSGTLARWIQENLDSDKKNKKTSPK